MYNSKNQNFTKNFLNMLEFETKCTLWWDEFLNTF